MLGVEHIAKSLEEAVGEGQGERRRKIVAAVERLEGRGAAGERGRGGLWHEWVLEGAAEARQECTGVRSG